MHVSFISAVIQAASPTTRRAAVDVKEVLSKICSGIPAKLVGSLFHASGIKIEQEAVDQYGSWESTTCMITGSGELALSALAQIGPLTVSAQDGLNAITHQSGGPTCVR
jgi:hypothetical protein